MTRFTVHFLEAEDGAIIESGGGPLDAETLDAAEVEVRARRPSGAKVAKISDGLLVRKTLYFDFDA